jgi:hypothetical protein
MSVRRIMQDIRAAFDARDPRRPMAVGITVTVVVHVLAALVFTLFDSSEGMADPARYRHSYLCNGKTRCGFQETRPLMRGLDTSLSGRVDVIEAMVIPRLGLAKKRRGMPKLVKYEQPAKAKDGINIKKKNAASKKVKHKAPKKKKADLDKRRKKPPEKKLLSAIMGHVDDDPRKRATALDNIIGVSGGSVHGSGREASPGNVYAGKVARLMQRHFVVPTSIPRDELKKLKVRVRISKIGARGEVLTYSIIQRSKSAAYNLASEALIHKFSSKDGGKQRLPEPDPVTLGHVNQHGMIVDLDGALFRQ